MMTAISQIIKKAFSYKSSALFVIIFNILFVIFNVLSLVLFVPFLKIIFGSEQQEEVYKPTWETSKNIFDYAGSYYDYQMYQYVESTGASGALLFVCISVALAFLLKNLFRYLAIYNLSYMRMAVVRDLRLQIFRKVIHLPIRFFSEEKKGDIMSRMTNDLNEVENSVVSTLELFFREPLAIVAYLSVLLYWSLELTLFSLVLLPVSALVISRIGKSLKKTSLEGQNQLGLLLSRIEETITGLKVILAFNSRKNIQDKFEEENLKHQKISTKAFRIRDLSSPLNEFLGALVMITIVWFGGSLILSNNSNMTGEEFITYIILFSQLLRPIQDVAKAFANFSKGKAAIERINKILGAEEEESNPNQQPLPEFEDKIEYQNILFSYQNNEEVIHDVSFTIRKGQTVALVGESGSGKSTLADLLPRFYELDQGKILIDNNDTRNHTIDSLRKQIGIVTQDSILFNDTIYNNIVFGLENVTKEDVIHAAKIANANDFILEFPRGYDTNIGDGGGKLSGGQKQRICIARAVLKNPPIMILDEATSALDTESEKLVQKAIDELMKDRTSLVIAHRLSTIQNADIIHVLKNGRIEESGNHEELINKNGAYKRFYEMQHFL